MTYKMYIAYRIICQEWQSVLLIQETLNENESAFLTVAINIW